MSTTKAKVLKIEEAGEFQTKSGNTLYKWTVVTDAGDAGQVNTTKKEAPWKVGDEAEYEVEKKEYNGTTYTTLKKAGAAGFGGGGGRTWTPDPERETRAERILRQALIVRQSSIAQAVALVGGKVDTVDKVLGVAEQIEAWVNRGDVLKRMAGSAAAPAAKPAFGATHIAGHHDNSVPV